MFSQTSSIQEAFNYPDQTKDMAYSNRPTLGRIKRKSKQNQFQDGLVRVQKDKFFFKIRVIKLVGKFLQNLKSGIVLEKPNLKNSQLFYLESQTKINQKQNLFPYASRSILLVQILVCIFLCINIWKNTYQIVFSRMFDQPYVQSITLFIYGLHILLFHHTQFKNQKMELVSNREAIFNFYMNQRLLSDAIVLITLILQITPLNNVQGLFTIIRLSSFFMVKPLLQITKKLQDIISVSTQIQIIMSIAGLFARICLILHTLSLIFTLFSKAQKTFNVHYTWLESNNLQIHTDFQQYVVGWYWGATILSTVGFGDITPANHYQRGFISFIQVSCSICFGFFVNYIGSLITRMGESKKNYQKDVRMVNRFLLKQSLPDHLKSNIRCHYFNKYKIQQVYDQKTEVQILDTVSGHLKNQIIQTRNITVLSKSKLNAFSQDIIKKLSLCLKKMVFAPQQIIYSEKSKDLKLWIIQQGIVQQLPTSFNYKQDKAISFYNKDDQKTLGWINLLTQKNYKTTARAKTFTLGFQLKHEDFIKILKQKESDYNKMHEQKQFLIQKNRIFLNKCLSCQRFTHNVIQCPRIHFKHRTMYKIKLNEQKQRVIQKNIQKRKPHADRSKCRFSWKTCDRFTQYSQQIQSIVNKFAFKTQFDQDISRRCSMDSIANMMLKSKSINEKAFEKRASEKRSSEKRSTQMFQKDKKLNLTQIAIQLQDIPMENLIDKIYLGQGRNYLQHHDFNKIIKRYVLYMITIGTKKPKG